MKDISNRIRYVGLDDHKKILFEGLWPLPVGVSYNSYLVIDEKTALIDTADALFEDEFIRNIKSEIGERTVDYLIVNHMEPDHSSLIGRIRDEYPDITVIGNAKTMPMIEGYHGITGNMMTVKEGDVLNLGRTELSFHMTPMVHWPETMMTYLAEERTLFSGDAFGTFGALNGRLKDGFRDYESEMTRYYSNIVGKYGQTVQAALKKLSGIPVERICSTHGPVWEKDAAQVVALYDRLSRYEALKKGVCIVYGSMYGNTEKAALSLASELRELGVECSVHNLCTENPSFAYRDLFVYDTLAAGSPTYNNDIFPPVYNFMHGVGARLVKNRRFVAFGSYTWNGASVRLMNEMAQKYGFCFINGGISFPQAFSPEKCDMASVAAAIAGKES